MVKSILLPALLTICFGFNPGLAKAFVRPVIDENAKIESIVDLRAEYILNLDRKDLEKKIGRKLNLKERLALWLYIIALL